MNAPICELVAAVIELPAEQREVLVPLFARALLEQAPEGTELPPELERTVEAFFAELGPDPSQWGARIDERLRAAKITQATFGELALRAGLAKGSPTWNQLVGEGGPRFEPRAAPSPGQARSGPAARFQLNAVAAKSSKSE